MKFSDFLNEAPKAQLPEGIKLLQLLMAEVRNNYTLKLQPVMQQEALDEAVRMMRRIVAGADGESMNDTISRIADDLKALRRALLSFPTHEAQMNDTGIWFENKEIARTLQTAQSIQQSVVKSQVFMENLSAILSALDHIYQLIEDRVRNGSLDTAQLSFAKATFKKLGIL